MRTRVKRFRVANFGRNSECEDYELFVFILWWKLSEDTFFSLQVIYYKDQIYYSELASKYGKVGG